MNPFSIQYLTREEEEEEEEAKKDNSMCSFLENRTNRKSISMVEVDYKKEREREENKELE